MLAQRGRRDPAKFRMLAIEPVVRVACGRLAPQRRGCGLELADGVVASDAACNRLRQLVSGLRSDATGQYCERAYSTVQQGATARHGRSRATRKPMRALRRVGGAKSCLAARM